MKNRLQFITHHNERYGVADGVRMALDGGCRWVQLRVKEGSDEQVRPLAREVAALCRRAGATLIVDDRVQLAREIEADGVHLGKNDLPVEQARALLGSRFIIGGTANRIDEVRRLHRAGADYVGCGPLRFTTTKERLAPLLGFEGYRSIVETMRREGIALPLVAIGGVTIDDLPRLLSCGVSAVAVSGSILRAADPVAATARFVSLLNLETE